MNPQSCAGDYKRPPLAYTLDNDNVKAFKTLINLKADVNLPNRYGLTIFQEAILYDCVKVIDLVLRRGYSIRRY
jgi:ankyrin repeat protein